MSVSHQQAIVTSTAVARPRVLIIAPHGSYRTAAFIAAANKFDVTPTVVSQGKNSIVGSYAQGLHVDYRDPDQALKTILDEARRHPITAILATDDATTELAARAAHALGLPHNSPDSMRIARRKDWARARLAEAGVPVPRHRRVDLRAPLAAQAGHQNFPCVLKPLALSASRGVIRADNVDEFLGACARIERIVAAEADEDERRYLLAEDFIPGAEAAVEGMLNGGALEVLAIFDKPEPLNGPFFEETYYVTPTRLDADAQRKLHGVIGAACRAYGLREGPVHAECRINEHGVWILEIAARTIGGLCARMLHFGTGLGLEELVIAQAMKQKISAARPPGSEGVLMIPITQAGILRRVEGIEAARKVRFIEEVVIQIREGYELIPLPEGSSYLGFVFARAPTPADTESALRQAHARLKIVVAPLFQILSASPAVNLVSARIND